MKVYWQVYWGHLLVNSPTTQELDSEIARERGKERERESDMGGSDQNVWIMH